MTERQHCEDVATRLVEAKRRVRCPIDIVDVADLVASERAAARDDALEAAAALVTGGSTDFLDDAIRALKAQP